MQRTSLADMNCSIARSLEVIGEWWTLLILRDAFLGVRRFDDFQRSLGIARNVLTARLNRLVETGVLTRQRYQQHPDRHEYLLSERGLELFPIVVALIQWGDRWTAGEAGPPLVLLHAPGDHPAQPILSCSECGEPITPESVLPVPGPGAG